ncbi:cytochrome b [Paraglaciecola mesophila]|uniref:Cytochrome b n=1 Tax=Paraglaciecola mesophila TaxID=197222 RepID=A0ABU9SR35_9ALTE
MLKNSFQQYGWLSIAIHWLSAAVVIGMFAAGWWMVELSYYSPWYKDAPHYHKSVGILLMCLTVVRIIWKVSQETPKPLGKALEILAARATHALLYILIITLFVSGYLISTADNRGIDVFNWFSVAPIGKLFTNQEDLSGIVHEYVAYTLIALASLHGLAALKHHFINNDNTLVRMLTFKKHKEKK